MNEKVAVPSRLRRDPPPNYWVVKGRPSRNDFEGWLKPGRRDVWGTRRPPTAWANGDRLFFWRSAPSLEVVGLGEFLGLALPDPRFNDTRFGVKYLCPILSRPITMEQLRSNRVLKDASFLKAGPSGTVFRLTPEQGRRLYQIVCRQNPFVQDLWPDMRAGIDDSAAIPDVDSLDVSAEEGARRLVLHLRIERDRRLVEAKKRSVLSTVGFLECEVCEFDFRKVYGKLGDRFCEVHHRRGLSERSGARITKLSDLAVVCSNCHRMLHRMARAMSIEKLRRALSWRKN